MYLTAIYLMVIAILTLIPIFLSRRRNLRLLISFMITFILMYTVSFFDLMDNLFLHISNDILNGTKSILQVRFSQVDDMICFIYANLYLISFTIFFFVLYFVSGLFIKNKSNFREFDNIPLKTTLKALMCVFNIVSLYLMSALFLVNLNSYMNLELGFLDYIFEIARMVVIHL